MARFDEAAFFTLQMEGGFVASPADPGGATNYGISDRADGKTDGLIDTDRDGRGDVPVRELTHDQALAVYRKFYWPEIYGTLKNQNVATRLFDAGVLLGVSQAVKLAQEVLADRFNVSIAKDGVPGPKTVAAINAQDPVLFLGFFKIRLSGFFTSLCAVKPELRPFECGWQRRVFTGV